MNYIELLYRSFMEDKECENQINQVMLYLLLFFYIVTTIDHRLLKKA